MATQRVFNISVSPAQSPRTFPDPTNVPAGVNIPDKFNYIKFLFGQWTPAGRTLSVAFQISIDNGLSWQDFGSITGMRGDAVQKDGSPGASMTLTLGDTQNVNLRAIATATGGQINTSVTITAI